jgi:hypothetical protein
MISGSSHQTMGRHTVATGAPRTMQLLKQSYISVSPGRYPWILRVRPLNTSTLGADEANRRTP